MGCKDGLSASEKSIITSQLAEGKSTLEISKNIGRYLFYCLMDGQQNSLIIAMLYFVVLAKFS